MGILSSLFDDTLFINIQTHDKISNNSYNYMNQSLYRIVGGTNLLSSNMNRYNQWKVTMWDSLFISDIILLGVGWWQYQKPPNSYTRILYRRLLSKNHLHSVRDAYTEKMLKSTGIENVVNTSCPTMWLLSKSHCSGIPRHKSRNVILTFTEYNQNPDHDARVFKILSDNYDCIYFWPQQPRDYLYMKSLGGERVTYLHPSVDSLDAVLIQKDVDYIGTRLHAGIRALQYKRRAIILSVDNRALEIAKDTNLPVFPREDTGELRKWISRPYATDVTLPEENIRRWKEQF